MEEKSTITLIEEGFKELNKLKYGMNYPLKLFKLFKFLGKYSIECSDMEYIRSLDLKFLLKAKKEFSKDIERTYILKKLNTFQLIKLECNLENLIFIKKTSINNLIEDFFNKNLSLNDTVMVYIYLNRVRFIKNKKQILLEVIKERSKVEDLNKEEIFKFIKNDCKRVWNDFTNGDSIDFLIEDYNKLIEDLSFIIENYKNGNMDKFTTNEMSLEEAMNFHKELISLKFYIYDDEFIENCNNHLINIMIKNEYGDENFYNDINIIKNNTILINGNEEEIKNLLNEEEIDDEKIEAAIDNIIKYTCEKSNIEFKKSLLSEELFDSKDCDFNDIRERYYDAIIEFSDLENPEDNFFECGSDDCNIFRFKGIYIQYKSTKNINEYAEKNGFGIPTEAYNQGDNFYLNMQLGEYYRYNITFVLAIISALYLKK